MDATTVVSTMAATIVSLAITTITATSNATMNNTTAEAIDTSYLSTIPLPTDSTDGALKGGGQHWLIGTMVVLAPFTVVALIWRSAWRRHKKQTGPDDHLILFAGVAFVALTVCNSVATHYGNGKHTSVVLYNDPAFTGPSNTPHNLTMVLIYLIGDYVLYTICITAVKLSILASYRRIYFHIPMRVLMFTILNWACIAVGISASIGVFFLASPMSSIWDSTVQRTHVINIPLFFILIGAINCILDIAICLIGMWFAYKVRSKQLVQILVIYSLGLFACACSLIRVCRLEGLNGPDVTYTSVMAVSWSYIEAAVGIFTACLPPLHQPLVVVGHKLVAIYQSVVISSRKVASKLPSLRPTTRSTPDLEAAVGDNGAALPGPTPFSRPSTAGDSLAGIVDHPEHDIDPAEDKNAVEIGPVSALREITNHETRSECSLAHHKDAADFV